MQTSHVRMKPHFRPSCRCSKGFTLIELVIGMLVIGIAIVMMTSMLFPQADRSVETLNRVRSAELAHSIMNEIWGKRYDQHTNANGGSPACGSSETGALPCSTLMGPDAGEGRDDFNDVDDYHGLNQQSRMLNSAQTYADAYPNFRLSVTVVLGSVSNTKLVSINVTTPSSEVITYHLVRSNY